MYGSQYNFKPYRTCAKIKFNNLFSMFSGSLIGIISITKERVNNSIIILSLLELEVSKKKKPDAVGEGSASRIWPKQKQLYQHKHVRLPSTQQLVAG